MTQADIERIYEALAQTIDRVGPDQDRLFLAKLALLLGQDIGDPARVLDRIDDAARDLDVSRKESHQ